MDPRAAQMIEFLNRHILRDPDADLNEDTPLVSSGLVDSFALVEILTELERISQCRIPAGRVSPMDLNTVRQMLEVAVRWGESPPATNALAVCRSKLPPPGRSDRRHR